MKYIDMDDIRKVVAIPFRKIIIGGAALPFYGVKRGTTDIDMQVNVTSMEELEAVQKHCDDLGLNVEISANVSGWGMIPLADGFEDRLVQTEFENAFILSPEDFIVSKIRRGTKQDIEDCSAVVTATGVSRENVAHILGMVRLPLDSESLYFKKRALLFLDEPCFTKDFTCGI